MQLRFYTDVKETNIRKKCLLLYNNIYKISLSNINNILINNYNPFSFYDYESVSCKTIGTLFFENKIHEENIKDIPSLARYIFFMIDEYHIPRFDEYRDIFSHNYSSINSHEINNIETNATIINI